MATLKKAASILFTAAALGAAAIGIGSRDSSSEDGVPPHGERIAFLRENLRENKTYSLRYSPYFRSGVMASSQGMLLTGALDYGRTGALAFGMIDAAESNDGTADYGFLQLASRSGQRTCLIEDEELGSLEGVMDEHYAIATDAWYRSLTEGNGSVEGLLGRAEMEEMFSLCEGKWQSREDVEPEIGELLDAMGIPPHLERIAFLEKNLLALSMGVDSKYFTKVIFAYDDGRGNSQGDDAGASTRQGIIYTMLERSNYVRPLHYEMLSIRDLPYTETGEVDMVYLYYFDATSGEDRKCELWRYQIRDDDLLARLDAHYEASTEAAYRGLTEGLRSYRPGLTGQDYDRLWEFCGN